VWVLRTFLIIFWANAAKTGKAKKKPAGLERIHLLFQNCQVFKN
jgi:hypothetical protein